jgi:integrase
VLREDGSTHLVPDDVAGELAALRGSDEDALIFTSERGARIDPSNLMKRVVKPTAVTAGMGEWVGTARGRRGESWVGFHTFRHTCATILFRRGWNAVQVQRWLGHHKPSFTLDTYVHLLDEDVREPTFFDGIAAECDPDVTRTGLNGPKAPDAEELGNLGISRENAS